MSPWPKAIEIRARSLRAILFDKDGTLIDFQKSWGPVLAATCRMASGGSEAFAEQLMRLGGMDPTTLITGADTLFAAGNTAEIADAFISAGVAMPRDALIRAADRLFIGAAEQSVPVCDLGTLFARLRAGGLKLGIASSDSEAAIRRFLAHHRLEAQMDFVCGYDSGHGHKPEPGMALGFAAAIGIPGPAIAMVGDNMHDMRLGRSAGCGLVAGVLTGTGARETLAREGDIVLDSIADLPQLLGL